MLFSRKSCQAVPRAKRLAFESLERRDLLTVMRIVSWNTLNRPQLASDADYTTVLEAIGNETVLGNTKRLDILAVQETDGPEGMHSISNIATILDSLYMSAGADYHFEMSSVDDGNDRTGFVFDTSVITLADHVEIELSDHNILRGQFRPIGTAGESDFYVYTVHFTSSGGPVGRAADAALLRDDVDSLPEGTPILVMGDFNLEGSSEPAWSELVVSAGAGQLQDVANAPGEWSGDVDFLQLHTQAPHASMDDRFDIQFATAEVFDGLGFDYIHGSYRVFGNNGTHTLGMPITSGTWPTAGVLDALAAASDHLPVVVDYELIVSTPGVRIVQTGGETKAVEGGAYDVYSVVLDTIPDADVTVTVTPNAQVNLGAGAGVAVQLVFTPANALTPQTVIVNAANDLVGEGTHAGLITHSTSSADIAYNALSSLEEVMVAILDNDAPTIVINEVDSDTPGIDMLEFVELYDGGVGNTSLSGLSVVFFNGSNDQEDQVFDLTGFSTDANGFFVLGNAGIPSRDFQFNNNILQNGPDAVALYSGLFPNNGVVTTTNLLDAVVYDTSDPDDAGLLILLQPGQPQVNENGNGQGTTQSIARVPDHGTPRVTSTFVAQTPTPDAPNTPLPPGGYILVQSSGRTDVAEGGATDSYQLSLANFPTADVTITIDPDDQVDLGEGPGMPLVLTFTPANAIVPQTITVTAVDDAWAEGDHGALITHTAASADLRYQGLTIGDVVANIVDNDAALPESIVISEIMYDPASPEGGSASPEWIEIVNTGAGPVDILGWLFDDEDGTNWGPIGEDPVLMTSVLQPGQIAVIFDSDYATPATFRSEWAVPSNALVIGVDWGSLANSPGMDDEILELRKGLVQKDVVDFDDNSPWPSAGAGGPSIYLKNLATNNNIGANWAVSTNGLNRAHAATGGAYLPGDIGSPGYIPISADFNFDGEVSGLDFLAWQRGYGKTNPLKVDGDAQSDLDVDAGDLSIWEITYGDVASPLVEPLESFASSAVGPASLPANVFLALPALSSVVEPAPLADEAPLEISAIDAALTPAPPTTSPQYVVAELFLADADADSDAADEAFAEWDELTLSL